MDGNDHVTTHTAWTCFVSVVVLTALIIGPLLLVAQLRSHVPSLHVLWPKSEIVTLTGYGRLSPMNPSSDPTSVVLTHSQALAFNRAVAALSMEAGPNCHENSVVFTLSIAPGRGQTPDWKVTEWECPAPGTLYVRSAIGIQTYRGSVCSLISLVAQDLPKEAARGTRSTFKLCSADE
jgi:hypothetical protein